MIPINKNAVERVKHAQTAYQGEQIYDTANSRLIIPLLYAALLAIQENYVMVAHGIGEKP